MPKIVKRGLNLLDASMIIMGSMIGSGIFLVSPKIAAAVHTPGLLILSWVMAGVITICGALSYAELAAAMPKAGGQYVYLKEAYNKLVAFLYGWTLFAVIQTGTIAAVGIGFAKYSGVFFPQISDGVIIMQLGTFQISTLQLLAISVIMLLTIYNFSSVKNGAIMQNIFTFTKIAALMAIVVVGIVMGAGTGKGTISHFLPAFPDSYSFSALGIFFSAMVGSLFAADAWNNITFTAGEVTNPQRNLPRALLLGTGTVIIIYILVNIAYIYVLPIGDIEHADQGRVATLLLQTVVGNSGSRIMAVLVMVSTFGCLNGIILTGARVYFAMAKDGLFFPQAVRLNKNDVPANSLLFQGLWASGLVLTGSYGQLLDYVMFSVLLFYIFTIFGVFILRNKQPGLHRPYKVLGYPFIPVLYLLLAFGVCISMLVYNREYTLRGLCIVLIGIPLYYIAKQSFKHISTKD